MKNVCYPLQEIAVELRDGDDLRHQPVDVLWEESLCVSGDDEHLCGCEAVSAVERCQCDGRGRMVCIEGDWQRWWRTFARRVCRCRMQGGMVAQERVQVTSR